VVDFDPREGEIVYIGEDSRAAQFSPQQLHGAERKRQLPSRTRVLARWSVLCWLTAIATLAAHAQVAIDTTDPVTTGNAAMTSTVTNFTFGHTTAANLTNAVLVVGVSMDIGQQTGEGVSGITYSGVALKKAGAQNDAGTGARFRTEIWYLANPPSNGTNNVVVTVTGIGSGRTIGTAAAAITFTGADQTSPIRSYAGNGSNGTNGTNAWVQVNSSNNDYVLETLAASSGETVTLPSAAQVARWSLDSAGGVRSVHGFGSTRAGSPSVTMSETLSATSAWSDSAISIQPAQADLSLTAAGSSTPFPTNVSYTVSITNNGPDTATSVSLTDILATGLTLVSAVPTGGVGGSCTGANCSWTSIPKDGTASVTITATPAAPGGYTLSASVTASSADLNTTNNSATAVAYSQFAACAISTTTAGGNLGGVINTYYPGRGTAAAGSTTVTVGAATGAGSNIALGDLVLIIQMQDAAINSTNSSQYGNGVSGSGSTSLNSAGAYEYATAASAVNAGTGGTLTVQAAGPGGGLLYTYTSAAATSSQGARNFQVIRVPNYQSATLTSTLTASAWNGSTGGVLALNVSGTLTLGGATVSVDGLGFRGAAGLDQNGSATAANTDYVFTAPGSYNTGTLTAVAGAHGSKGEGIAGTPEWIENVTGVAAGVVTNGTVSGTGQSNAQGYPNGSMARGAPGNAGGGGTDGDPVTNDQNSGGGGGANGGAGGQGGNSWNSNLAVGGLGGTAFPGAVSRVVMGGGGGAGSSNNNNNAPQPFASSSGAPGGGIVMIRANTITGTATVTANGYGAYNATANDGGGGGGAGGSIVFLWNTASAATVTLDANGGKGGDAWDTGTFSNANRHGPGGGGGGGVLLYTGTGAAMTTAATGGAPGITLNTAGVNYGATAGAAGLKTGAVSLNSSPGPHSESVCADLSITKTGSPNPAIVNGPLDYTLTITNNSTTIPATNLTITDTIPSQVTYGSSTATGGSGGTCPAPVSGVLTCTYTSLGASATATIHVTTTATTPYSLAVNTAIVNSTTPDPNPTNNTATASIPIEGPTAVRVESFSAARAPAGVVLSWKTGGELHNLGFNVYKDVAGEKVRLNPSLIAGSALLMREALEQHGAKTYAWIDNSATSGGAYWLEDVDLNGTRTMHGPIQAQGNITATRPIARAATMVDLARAASTQPASAASRNSGLLQSQPHVRETVVRPRPSSATQNIGFELAARNAVKIFVDHEGWYRVTQPQLAAAGLRGDVDARSLHLFAEGVEQPIRITGGDGSFGPQSAIEFYGTAIDTFYSGQRVYWLVAQDQPGQRIGTEMQGTSGPQPRSFLQTLEVKPRTTYFAALLRDDTDNFFGPLITPTSANLSVNIQDLAEGGASLELALQGVTLGQQHEVTVALNGATLGDVTFSDQQEGKSRFTVPAGVLANGANTITLTAQQGSNDLSLVDYIDVSFPHTFTAESDQLKFSAPAGSALNVNGFVNPPTRLIDISNPQQPVMVPLTTLGQQGAYTLQATVPGVSSGTHWLMALADDQLATPVLLVAHQPSHLHSAQPGAQLVLLTAPQFASQFEPIAKLHQARAESTALISVDAVYDEFNFGERTPYAIRDFLRTATAAWKTKPHYLLLGGDASLDPRNYLGFGFSDFVPTKLIVTAYLKTASDDWFSDFNLAGVPSIATGRLPARTSSDAQIMTGKILSYANGQTGSWTNQSLMVAGVDDPTLSFSQAALAVQQTLPKTMTVTDIFASVVGVTPARQDILSSINAGQLLVNYNGHGSVQVWGNNLLDDTSASALTNGSKLPLVVAMNCLNGYFQDVYTTSLASALMLAPNGGAVAVWASSGLTVPDPQFQMDRTLVQTLFSTPGIAVGDAVVQAKSGIADQDARRTFIFFGDPLMRLKTPANTTTPAQK
jgi:uncharacterized repeat protein (TIGR01451 family)